MAAELPAGLGAALSGAGVDPGARTLWVAEGLFFYLTEDSIVELLRTAGGLSGPGSRFLADVIGSVGLDGPAMRPYADWCRRTGQPPPFGHGDPAGLFAAGGWTVEDVRSPGAPDANYGRLPPLPPGPHPGRTHLVAAVPVVLSGG